MTFVGGRCPPTCRFREGAPVWLIVLPPSRPVGGAVLVEEEEEEEKEEELSSVGPVGGALLALFPEPAGLVGGAEPAEEEVLLPSVGPVGGALLAIFPEPAGPVGGAEPAEEEVLPPGPVVGALLALFPGPARLMGGAVLASGYGRGGMGVAVSLVKDGYRLLAVPLKSPTPQNSSRSACEAAPCCCALDGAALALSFAFKKNLLGRKKAAESPSPRGRMEAAPGGAAALTREPAPTQPQGLGCRFGS